MFTTVEILPCWIKKCGLCTLSWTVKEKNIDMKFINSHFDFQLQPTWFEEISDSIQGNINSVQEVFVFSSHNCNSAK